MVKAPAPEPGSEPPAYGASSTVYIFTESLIAASLKRLILSIYLLISLFYPPFFL